MISEKWKSAAVPTTRSVIASLSRERSLSKNSKLLIDIYCSGREGEEKGGRKRERERQLKLTGALWIPSRYILKETRLPRHIRGDCYSKFPFGSSELNSYLQTIPLAARTRFSPPLSRGAQFFRIIYVQIKLKFHASARVKLSGPDGEDGS